MDMLKKGMIMLWPVVDESSEFEKLPANWKDCDGREGRPNLKGRLVCGYDYSNPDGLSEMGRTMTDKANRMGYIKSGGLKYMYGHPEGSEVDKVFMQWNGLKIRRVMMPNHVHHGSAHSDCYVQDIVLGNMKYPESRPYTPIPSPQGIRESVEKFQHRSVCDHTHKVVVGDNDDNSMMGEDVIGLPRPPLIVLRYIIYWPD